MRVYGFQDTGLTPENYAVVNALPNNFDVTSLYPEPVAQTIMDIVNHFEGTTYSILDGALSANTDPALYELLTRTYGIEIFEYFVVQSISKPKDFI